MSTNEGTNKAKFGSAYTKELTKSILKTPDAYAYGVEKVPQVIDRMLMAIEQGDFNVSTTLRRVCKTLGIRPTQHNMVNYVRGEEKT